MGRYWSTRRAGSQGPPAATGPSLPVVSNIRVSEPNGPGAALYVIWDCGSDPNGGFVVNGVLAPGVPIGDTFFDGDGRGGEIEFACPLPGNQLVITVSAIVDEVVVSAADSDTYECVGD